MEPWDLGPISSLRGEHWWGPSSKDEKLELLVKGGLPGRLEKLWRLLIPKPCGPLF